MIRNIKALGLSVVAVLAMSAVVASAAQATPIFEASEYPASFSGSNTKGNEVFTTEAGKVECDSSFSGTANEASSEVTAHPTYTGCEAFGFLEATVNTTGCNYKFHLASKSGAVYNSSADIVCSGAIKITALTCAAEVKPQSGLTNVEMANASGSIKVTPNVTGIAYTVTKDGFLCPFSGTGNKTGGTYTGGGVTISSAGKTLAISGE